jgi:hypothetical protein
VCVHLRKIYIGMLTHKCGGGVAIMEALLYIKEVKFDIFTSVNISAKSDKAISIMLLTANIHI